MGGNSWRRVCLWVTKSLYHLHDSFTINVLLFEEQLTKYSNAIPLQLWIFLPQNSWFPLLYTSHSSVAILLHAHFVFCPPSGLIFSTRVSGNRQLNRLRWVLWWEWRSPYTSSSPTTWSLLGDLQNDIPANCSRNTVWYCMTLCP